MPADGDVVASMLERITRRRKKKKEHQRWCKWKGARCSSVRERYIMLYEKAKLRDATRRRKREWY